MQVTQVKIEPVKCGHEPLLAFCVITLDGEFVVRDVRIIAGNDGPFLAFPCRKLMYPCPGCHAKNHLRAKYCNHCGSPLDDEHGYELATKGRKLAHQDVAHPIDRECRAKIERAVLEAYAASTVPDQVMQ